MTNDKICLNKECSIWLDEKNDQIVNTIRGKIYQIPDTQIGKMFLFLLSKPGEKILTVNIASHLNCEITSDKTSEAAVKTYINRLKIQLKSWGISCSHEPKYIGEILVIENKKSMNKMMTGNYTLYLPTVDARVVMANLYWDRYLKIGIYKSNNSLMELKDSITLNEVYVTPRITSRNLVLIDSKERNWNLCVNSDQKYLIQAPNGFGKSTFMKSLLLSAIYDSIDNLNEPIVKQFERLRQFHGIGSGYLPIFIEAKSIYQYPQENADTCEWLFDVLSLDENINLDMKCNAFIFTNMVEHYNKSKKILLLIDGYDEIDHSNQIKLFDTIRKFQSSKYGSNAITIITTRPYLQFEKFNSYKSWCIDRIDLEKDEEMVKNLVANYSKYAIYSTESKQRNLYEMISLNPYLRLMTTNPTILIRVIIGCLFSSEPHQIVEDSIKEMLLRFRYKNTLSNVRHYKMVYEEIAFEMLRNKSVENGLISNVSEFELMIQDIIDRLQRVDSRFNQTFDELNNKDLGDFFYTKVALLENIDGAIEFSVPLIYSLHFAARKIVRLMESGSNTYSEVLVALNEIEYKYRFRVMGMAATIMNSISALYNRDFSFSNQDIIFEFAEFMFDYMKSAYDKAKSNQEIMVHLKLALKDILENRYGENIFTRRYNEVSDKVKFDIYLSDLSEMII